MAYQKAVARKGRDGRTRVVYQALGDFSSDTKCSDIPANDPYRKSGNYCTQPSGNVIMFNSDGSVPADPFASGGGSSSSDSSSSSDIFGSVAKGAGALLAGLFGAKPPSPTMPVQTGMSTTTKVALAGAAVVGLALILRSRD